MLNNKGRPCAAFGSLISFASQCSPLPCVPFLRHVSCRAIQVISKVTEVSNIVLSNVVESPKSLTRQNTINVSA